jgi:hypothetical protein
MTVNFAWFEPQRSGFLIGLAFLLLNAWCLYGAFGVARVSEEGLAWNLPGWRRFVPWSELIKVHPASSWLRVHTTQGVWRVSNNLADFGTLYAILIEKTPHEYTPLTLPFTVKARGGRTIQIGAFAALFGIALLCFFTGELLLGVMMLATCAFALWADRDHPVRWEFTELGLTSYSLTRMRQLPWSQLIDARLAAPLGHPAVELNSHNRDPIVVLGDVAPERILKAMEPIWQGRQVNFDAPPPGPPAPLWQALAWFGVPLAGAVGFPILARFGGWTPWLTRWWWLSLAVLLLGVVPPLFIAWIYRRGVTPQRGPLAMQWFTAFAAAAMLGAQTVVLALLAVFIFDHGGFFGFVIAGLVVPHRILQLHGEWLRAKPDPVGESVSPADQPVLWPMVRELAQRHGVPPPEVLSFCLFGQCRFVNEELVISLAHLRLMTLVETRGVLAYLVVLRHRGLAIHPATKAHLCGEAMAQWAWSLGITWPAAALLEFHRRRLDPLWSRWNQEALDAAEAAWLAEAGPEKAASALLKCELCPDEDDEDEEVDPDFDPFDHLHPETIAAVERKGVSLEEAIEWARQIPPPGSSGLSLVQDAAAVELRLRDEA